MKSDHDHAKPASGIELKVKALESLVERQIVEAAASDAIVDRCFNEERLEFST
jgi:hypothetical protein